MRVQFNSLEVCLLAILELEIGRSRVRGAAVRGVLLIVRIESQGASVVKLDLRQVLEFNLSVDDGWVA